MIVRGKATSDRPGNLCVRADASPRIGTGHIMRCIALGQAWRDRGGGVTFLGSRESRVLEERVRHEGFGWVTVPEPHPAPVDLESTLRVLSELCTSAGRWVVLDGYHFDEGYQLALQAAEHRVLVIDDTGHLPQYHADIVLNQNTPSGAIHYRTAPSTELLLGNRYVLLRREFLDWKGEARRHPETAGNVLVTLGGADPDNVTRSVIDVLGDLSLPRLSVRVLVGASNPHRKSLEHCASSAGFDCRLVEATDRMPEWMAWADMAVSAAGTTCWEMAFMGLPNLVLVIAENQQAVISTLLSAGCSIVQEDPGDIRALHAALEFLIRDGRRRERMSKVGRELIDGLGGRRVVDFFLHDDEHEGAVR